MSFKMIIFVPSTITFVRRDNTRIGCRIVDWTPSMRVPIINACFEMCRVGGFHPGQQLSNRRLDLKGMIEHQTDQELLWKLKPCQDGRFPVRSIRFTSPLFPRNEVEVVRQSDEDQPQPRPFVVYCTTDFNERNF